jgi:riboflavin kinase/FMN adenylyltransferase
VELYRDHEQLPEQTAPCAVAIGSFDGLHLGHRLLIERTCERAQLADLVAAVLTFEPHPARALAPGLSPPLLMDYGRKLNALQHLGVARVLAQRFGPDFAGLSPTEFCQRVLVDGLRATQVVVGDDFTFGRGGQGRTDDLEALGKKLGFQVEVVRKLAVEGMVASSTRIRAFLLQGRVRAAGLLLGRAYTVVGRVTTGVGRGRKIGFATANLKSDAELFPARGVYVSHVWCAGWPAGKLALTNVGTNPTFGPGPQTVETHLIDFDQDLTGRPMALAFRERLRSEVAFASVDALVAQIGVDVARARELSSAYPEAPRLDPVAGIVLA